MNTTSINRALLISKAGQGNLMATIIYKGDNNGKGNHFFETRDLAQILTEEFDALLKRGDILNLLVSSGNISFIEIGCDENGKTIFISGGLETMKPVLLTAYFYFAPVVAFTERSGNFQKNFQFLSKLAIGKEESEEVIGRMPINPVRRFLKAIKMAERMDTRGEHKNLYTSIYKGMRSRYRSYE